MIDYPNYWDVKKLDRKEFAKLCSDRIKFSAMMAEAKLNLKALDDEIQRMMVEVKLEKVGFDDRTFRRARGTNYSLNKTKLLEAKVSKKIIEACTDKKEYEYIDMRAVKDEEEDE